MDYFVCEMENIISLCSAKLEFTNFHVGLQDWCGQAGVLVGFALRKVWLCLSTLASLTGW